MYQPKAGESGAGSAQPNERVQHERQVYSQKWPNALPITRAALIDRIDFRALPSVKIALILSTRSGVGCMGLLGRQVVLP